ncbi:MAG: metallophosphoesterase [bacterium]|nr:metallophosphoesterase [bacterium]
MKRIGVISDTHVPSRAKAVPGKVFEAFQGVDMIFHAGDIVSFDVLHELELLAPVYAVAGNMDNWEVRLELPPKRTIIVEDVTFGLTHGHMFNVRSERAVREAMGDIDCLIYGHTHKADFERIDGIRIFNPGTTVGGVNSSVGLITVNGTAFETEWVALKRD